MRQTINLTDSQLRDRPMKTRDVLVEMHRHLQHVDTYGGTSVFADRVRDHYLERIDLVQQTMTQHPDSDRDAWRDAYKLLLYIRNRNDTRAQDPDITYTEPSTGRREDVNQMHDSMLYSLFAMPAMDDEDGDRQELLHSTWDMYQGEWLNVMITMMDKEARKENDK